MYPVNEKRFLAVNYITIIVLFVLILAGGVVRSSGSGMGCPDWPKCFDRYIPPVNAAQLPANYSTKYISQRIAKNERFAKTLDVLGFGEMADRIRNDKSILKPEEFNAAKTWTEYINRLIGALCGFFLLACVIFSVTYLRSKKRIFFLSLFNVFLVGFQAWLGSIVVSTNLLAWVVTVHMLIALAIVAISIYTYFQARVLRDDKMLSGSSAGWVKALAVFVLILTVIQITLGTEVREQIDFIASAMNNSNRPAWVAEVGLNFNLHRDLAAIVFLSNIFLFFIIKKRYALNGWQFRFISYAMLLIVAQVMTGVVLAYFGLPPIAQAAHLLLASLLFGAQYYLMLLLGRKELYNRN